jgi:hypothetical protein
MGIIGYSSLTQGLSIPWRLDLYRGGNSSHGITTLDLDWTALHFHVHGKDESLLIESLYRLESEYFHRKLRAKGRTEYSLPACNIAVRLGRVRKEGCSS